MSSVGECRSLYCSPMPDEATLDRMYGDAYGNSFHHDASQQDPKEPRRVVDWLERLGQSSKGTFVDYGCGDGALLVEAARLGWAPIGMEFEPTVAASVAKRTGFYVVDRNGVAALTASRVADVLHLGDVIEHLTDPIRELGSVLSMLKPGGVLIAQGPLEANTTLFTAVLRWGRRLRRAQYADMAPYHVMLATARGQKRLFQRLGLIDVDFAMREVSWPAPHRLTSSDWMRPRSLGLFACRRVSQAVTALNSRRFGNRYFYVGRRESRADAEVFGERGSRSIALGASA